MEKSRGQTPAAKPVLSSRGGFDYPIAYQHPAMAPGAGVSAPGLVVARRIAGSSTPFFVRSRHRRDLPCIVLRPDRHRRTTARRPESPDRAGAQRRTAQPLTGRARRYAARVRLQVGSPMRNLRPACLPEDELAQGPRRHARRPSNAAGAFADDLDVVTCINHLNAQSSTSVAWR